MISRIHHFFRHASIQQKQVRIIMGVCTLALVLAGAGSVIYDTISQRQEMASFLLIRCDLLGRTCSGALDFQDPKAALENLNALEADPHMVAATVFTTDGKPFAHYNRTDASHLDLPLISTNVVTVFNRGRLRAARPILRGEEHLGFIVLESDLGALEATTKSQAGIAALVFALATTLAYFLSSRLQRIISGPILGLLETTRAVAANRNYSLRARKESADELGQLVDGFNHMLQQVQSRDAELQLAQNFLEKRVQVRTEELEREVVERRRSEKAVQESQKFLQSTLDALSAHIAILDESGVILSVNAAWYRFTCNNQNDTAGLGAGWNYLEVCDRSQGKCAEEAPAVARGIRTVLAGETAEFLLEYPCHSPSEKRWFIVRVTCFGDEDARRVVVAHENITERKLAEAESAKAQSALVDLSRQAGMAEMATGVLHNVGNVLNSVNVASTCIADGIRKSKATSLAKVVDLLRAHESDLGGFFTNDPKGRQIPGYLAQLADHLVGEQATIQKELAELQQHIDHIKEIVASQQSLAKVSGLTETLNVTDVMEEALRLNQNSLATHRMEIIREFATVPLITVEKHKVLQILVNLVQNAKQACKAAGRDDNQMTLRIMSDQERVRISVSDNGVGIPAENLTRVFNHGFTTKKTGHGFGLHNAANAAREMGGGLHVHSQGVGQGATFTLELPAQPLEKKTDE